MPRRLNSYMRRLQLAKRRGEPSFTYVTKDGVERKYKRQMYSVSRHSEPQPVYKYAGRVGRRRSFRGGGSMEDEEDEYLESYNGGFGGGFSGGFGGGGRKSKREKRSRRKARELEQQILDMERRSERAALERERAKMAEDQAAAQTPGGMLNGALSFFSK